MIVALVLVDEIVARVFVFVLPLPSFVLHFGFL